MIQYNQHLLFLLLYGLARRFFSSGVAWLNMDGLGWFYLHVGMCLIIQQANPGSFTWCSQSSKREQVHF